MNEPDAVARLKLQAWLSAGFPVGGFAYSQGLEAAHAAGDLGGAAALESWLAMLLDAGALRNDAILLALAWRAGELGEESAIAEVASLATALASGRERRLETTAQGQAFARAILTSWDAPGLAAHYATAGRPLAYPVAVGIAAAAHGVPRRATIEAYLCASLQNAASAAARLGIVGQTDCQALLARLLARVPAAAAEAATAEADELGSATLRADILGFHHEQQYSRLFRS